MLRVQTIIKAAGIPAALVISLLMLYLIARLRVEPWWLALILAAPPGLFILSGIPWLLSGGEHGTNIEVRDGDRYLAISNWNLFASAFARATLENFQARTAPLPRPRGRVISDRSPAQEGSVIETDTALPPGVEVAQKPIEIPKDAGQLP
jgi:hypothetical protein